MFSTRALLLVGAAATLFGITAIAAAGPSSLFDRIRDSRAESRAPASTQVGTSMGGDHIVVSHALGRVAQTAPRDRSGITLLTRHLGDPDAGKSKDDEEKSNRDNVENGDRDHHDHHEHHHHHP